MTAKAGDLARPGVPDYTGPWVGAVMPALLGDRDGDLLPAPARAARQAVLLVLDGFGWAELVRHRERLPQLAGMAGGPVPSVVPSTTAAGLTSIATGRPPAEHGIVGYRIRVGGEVLNVLAWRTAGGRDAPEPERVQPHRSFGGRQVPLVIRSEFADSGFTRAHLRDGRVAGWRTTAVLVERCRQLVAGGEPLVYAYYDGVDKVAHEFGLHGPFYSAELADTDRLVGALLDALPEHCALVVTSDHGQVHVGSEGMRALDALAPLVAAWSGEARFRSLYARAGAVGELRAAAAELVGDEGWVLTREQLFDEGWLGGRGAPEVRGRIGEVVLAARTAVGYVAPDLPGEAELVSCHGSITPEEVQVPLLAARGRA